MLEGWKCPSCGRVNSPTVSTCPCYTGLPITPVVPYVPIAPIYPNPYPYNIFYNCANCGAIIYSYPHYCWYYNPNRVTWTCGSGTTNNG